MEIVIANESHFKYAQIISDTITESAKVRGTGIAQRTPEYIIKRLQKRKCRHCFGWRKVCRFLLYRSLGKQRLCGKFWIDRSP